MVSDEPEAEGRIPAREGKIERTGMGRRTRPIRIRAGASIPSDILGLLIDRLLRLAVGLGGTGLAMILHHLLAKERSHGVGGEIDHAAVVVSHGVVGDAVSALIDGIFVDIEPAVVDMPARIDRDDRILHRTFVLQCVLLLYVRRGCGSSA